MRPFSAGLLSEDSLAHLHSLLGGSSVDSIDLACVPLFDKLRFSCDGVTSKLLSPGAGIRHDQVLSMGRYNTKPVCALTIPL